jgi:hypothetical protein
MKNILFTFIFGLAVSTNVSAQTTKMAASTWDRLSTVGGFNMRNTSNSSFLESIPPPQGEIIGTQYYDSTWAEGKIVLFNDSTIYSNLMARLDLKNNYLEVKQNNKVRVLEARRINYFSLLSPQMSKPKIFVNSQSFKKEEDIKGFFEVLSTNEKLILFLHKKFWLKKPTYVTAFDVGSRDAKIYHLESLYYGKADDDKVYELKTNKKNLLKIMADKQAEMETYFKEKSPDLKDNRDLANLFNYYNGLK